MSTKRKKELQAQIAEVRKERGRIEVARMWAEGRLNKAKSEIDELKGGQKRRLAEIALIDDRNERLEALSTERARLDDAERDIREMPAMIDGLTAMLEDLQFNMHAGAEDELRQILNKEDEDRRLAVFEKLKAELWRGDWEQLQIESGMEPEEFRKMRELYSRKHKL